MKMKVKVKVKKEKLFVRIKIPAQCIVNEGQSSAFQGACAGGFLKLSNVKKNRLTFTGPAGISMYQRLAKPISEYDFFFAIEQMINIVQTVDEKGLYRSNLLLDLNCIFYSESTRELFFIYLPVAIPRESADILACIQQMIYLAKPTETNANYLSEFHYYIKKLGGFDAKKIEAYVYQVNADIIRIIKHPDYKELPHTNTTGDANNGDDETITDCSDGDDEPTDFMEGNLSDDDETMLADDSESAELEYMELEENKFPMLIRTLTGEVIKIDKPVFRIGKEENCVDYIVNNNAAISRSHADIICRNGKYYVFDLRSKNKSYVNNRVLPAEYEMEIFDGDVIKLANEEFVFRVWHTIK